jgi:hypothetical protein
VPRKEDLNRRRVGKVHPTPARAWHTGLSDGAPDSVRWCTGQCSVVHRTMFGALGWSTVNVRTNGRLGTTDCLVCTRQCPVRQRPRRTNGRLCPIWKEITHQTAIGAVWWCTVLSGAPLDRWQELPTKLISNGS